MPDPDANDTRRVTHSAHCLLCLLVALLSRPTVADAAEAGAESAKQSASLTVTTGVLTGLGKSLKIRSGAGSFEGLVRLTRPTFTWKDCELIWIHMHPSGVPSFELDHAFVYQPPGAELQWVLVQSLNGERDEFADAIRAFHTHAVAIGTSQGGPETDSTLDALRLAQQVAEFPANTLLFNMGGIVARYEVRVLDE